MMSKTLHIVTPTPPADNRTFLLQKQFIRPIAVAIAELQGMGMPGKFARKVGRIRRAIGEADEAVQAERIDLVQAHSERYPLEGHERAGQFVPVYARDSQGNIVLHPGSEEPVALRDQYNVINSQSHQQDERQLLEEYISVECPCFLTEELDSFGQISGRAMDALMNLEEDST